MSRFLLFLIFLVLASADLAAVLVASGRFDGLPFPPIPAALAIHAAISLLAALVVRIHPASKDRPGISTLGTLSSLICLLTPVAGCVVAGWLVTATLRNRRLGSPAPPIHLGNPVSDAARQIPPAAVGFTEPLIEALRQGHRPVQRLAAPLLRLSSDRRAIIILRDLKEQSDARTHLHAQAALASSAERRNRNLARLRRLASETDSAAGNEAFARQEQLASALQSMARLEPPAEAAALLEESLECHRRASTLRPGDAASLFGQADCLIRLGRLDGVPDLYGRIRALPGATRMANRVELAYFAAMGNWKRTSEAVQRISHEDGGADLGIDCRQFWLLPHSGRA